ncbi:MAG: hypothetical protein KBD76_05705 [Bacteriovorax sp.]|nr:hypothetical protein [Bacteriovorax sp.]
MKNGFLISALSVSLSLSSVFACDIHGKTGFMPENNLRISKFAKDTNGMTEEKFLSIVKRVSDVYAPIVKSKGATLSMINDWDDETVNAYANRVGKVWEVHMFGGLARHTLTTDDGFMLVVCHETGHHLGGAPRYGGGSDWATNEGQADYFGTLKCMRRVIENDDNVAIVSKMKIDAEATKQCEAVYKTESEVALCQRIAMAGKSLGMLLGSLGGSSKVNFDTPDKKVVRRTNDNHPAAQCRLDTYFSGSLCDKSYTEDVSDTSPIPGTCIKRDGYTAGVRPLCWYKPGSGE